MAGVETDEMSCRELVQVVTEYLEGSLPEPDRARLEAHLRDCRWCEEYVEQMRQTVAALGEIPPDRLDPATEERLLAAFRGWRRAAG